MTNYTHTFFDALTGETTVVDFTENEITQHKAEIKAQAKVETDKATAKQAVLDRLGITADEAALLLG